jgi:hypothetical protein
MSTATETAQEYAQRRANETGRPYIISAMGHAVVDCRLNRRGLNDNCGGVVLRRHVLLQYLKACHRYIDDASCSPDASHAAMLAYTRHHELCIARAVKALTRGM